MTATSRLITLGAVASISEYLFMRYVGVGIEGWAVDARQAHQDIFVDFSDGVFASSIQHQSNVIGGVLVISPYVIRFPARVLRHTFLAELVGSLAGASSKSTSALSSRAKVSMSSRQRVIPAPRHGQSVRLAAAWKSG